MFIENYRREDGGSIMAGGQAKAIPYPKILQDDWRVWNVFLPVRSHKLDRKAAFNFSPADLLSAGIPSGVASEIQKATEHFDQVEIWRKRQIDKDPIAVGLVGQERYLIARWGMEKLLPFETLKRAMPFVLAWKYATSPLGMLVEFAGLALLGWTLLFQN
jgi:hypothetical protein